jgi:NAD+ diphosphatase
MSLFTPIEFAAAVSPPDEHAGQAYWFVFHGARMLIAGGDAVRVPRFEDPRALGLDCGPRHYLGSLGGVACYALEVGTETPPPEGMEWSLLRPLFPRIDDGFLALAGRALQVVEWDRTHRYCGRCGTPTEPKSTERVRVCPSCSLTFYPRLAPVVMALVVRGRELLLARSPHFIKGMYSALAGFVEAGENLEECLVREVREEVGIEIDTPRYFASQPWPFPHSLMIAYSCRYAGGELRPDPSEIEDAGWFDIDHLPMLPHRLSIARKLIDAVLVELRAG